MINKLILNRILLKITTSATTNIHSDKDEDTLVNMKDDDILVINS